MQNPKRKPPLCPIHGEPMRYISTAAGDDFNGQQVEHFQCDRSRQTGAQCSCIIRIPALNSSQK